ncbi:NotI family restriction endonuclease [Spirosoma sordidisoli]|uniref:Restriction endonuclease type II NotI domain-containing protein n=1 Tax=Spirosoma sordidisoli TaxID=2502893 RepID=A0A4V1RVC0_9BACT|nr:NotI family restriction endonuclease [Spirosoma sordidisoli]RYC66238.1 hypothetical protein EQG79_30670 [Spirosoma sordidisoli]
MATKVSELFCFSTDNPTVDWKTVVGAQQCVFLNRKCWKTRKSEPQISIGTCTVKYGQGDVIICPTRLLEGRKIFLDCIHLLTLHEPGNDLHVIPEVGIPGGNIDFFLASTREGKVRDFVGIELQTLDTTGTVWPERQLFLQSVGVNVPDPAKGTFGMNWKMTAKTILVQLHHKIQTFEHLNKHMVLVVQDHLLSYMQKEFSFGHIAEPPRLGDSMHFHAYGFTQAADGNYALRLAKRMSTDGAGIAACLGLQAEAAIELEMIVNLLEKKMLEGKAVQLSI